MTETIKTCANCYQERHDCKYLNTEQILRLESGQSCPYWQERREMSLFVKEIIRKLKERENCITQE